MDIKVLGSCCGSCEKLKKLAEETVKEMGLSITVEKVSDMKQIAAYGVMSTPALVINEKVKVAGRIPAKDVIKKYIQEEK